MSAARRRSLGARPLASALLVVVGALTFTGCPSPPQPPPVPEQADRVVVEKSRRELFLLQGDRVIRRFRIALGWTPVGPKTMERDGRTPEGTYTLDWRNPNSQYHLALHVSYPDAVDCEQAYVNGVSPGGDIMIHGLPNDRPYWGADHARTDWTAGCIAVTNEEIEDIWTLVPDGTPIDIRP
jgi:murein L,D-transpeptidase YafK